jgi:hypothetical protein
MNSRDIHPRRGKGVRDLDCEFYDKCLMHAARRNWKSFNCEECLKRESMVGEERETNTKICSECQDRPTIHPNSSLCASCMAKKSKAKREAEAQGQAGRRVNGELRGKPKKAILGQMAKPGTGNQDGQVVEVNFFKYPGLLEAVRKKADEDLRPVDLQILFIVKTYLKDEERVNGR